MPKVMKPPSEYDSNAVDTGGDWYDGPLPAPGLYKGVLKKILYQPAKNDKPPAIMPLCEITEGAGGSTKFKGAGVSKWLKLDKKNSPWINQFLHALTDGSEAQKAGVRKAFGNGYTLDDPDQKGKVYLIKIGKTNPLGRTMSFMVRNRTIEGGERDGEKVAEISRFVLAFNDSDDDDDAGDDNLSPEEQLDQHSDDDGDSGDDSDYSDDSGSDDDSGDDDGEPSAESGATDDGDDPWSIG